jgi:hypothetical protein
VAGQQACRNPSDRVARLDRRMVEADIAARCADRELAEAWVALQPDLKKCGIKPHEFCKQLGTATPFTRYLEEWVPHAALKPRPLDQAISTLKEFARAVEQPIEKLEAKHVQGWIDGLINPDGDHGLSAATVGRKLSELRNSSDQRK